MDEEDLLLDAFKGLKPNQVKELTDRLQQAVAREIQSFKKGEKMSNDYFGDLSEDEIREALAQAQAKKKSATPQGQYTDAERAIIDQAADQAKAQIEAQRMQPRINEYKQAMLKARGNRQELMRIRERYRAAGVPVDSVDFTDMV